MNEQIQEQTERDVIFPKEIENEEASFYAGNEEENSVEQTHTCRACGSYMVEEGYTLDLCSQCRDELSKRPIPIQMKAAAIVFILVAIFSLMKFPTALRAGIEYERGIKAEEALKYTTALNHFKNAAITYPDSDKIMVRLLSAYYENQKIDEAYGIFDRLAGDNPQSKKMDKDLIAEVNTVMDKMDLYYNPGKELYAKLKEIKNGASQEVVNTVKAFVDKDPKEVYGAYYLADLYFEMNKFEEANSILTKVLTNYPDFYSGQLLEASVLRELGQYDRAIECAHKVLGDNSENVGAVIVLSKIELKRKNNEKGLEYAKQAYALDSSEPYVMANLSLAYHYNNKIKERDEKFKIAETLISNDKYTINLLSSIFNGDLKWQK